MRFQQGNFYHVLNRGNNRQKIFFKAANYDYFIKKISNELGATCNIIAYCLMPNHFHLLLHVDVEHTMYRPLIRMQNLERKIGSLQSSYTRAINKQEKRTGSLFQVRAKVIEFSDYSAATLCFHYIHQNPVKGGLTSKMEDWKPSSYVEYFKGSEGICRREVAYELLGIKQERSEFQKQSIEVIRDGDLLAAMGVL